MAVFGFSKNRVNEISGFIKKGIAKQIPSHFPGDIFLIMKDKLYLDFDFKVHVSKNDRKVSIGMDMKKGSFNVLLMAFDQVFQEQYKKPPKVNSVAVFFPTKWIFNSFKPIGITELSVMVHWTDYDRDFDYDEANKKDIRAIIPKDK